MIGDAVAVALALLAGYLIAAFIGISWNPADWALELRVCAGVITPFVAMGAVCARRGIA